MAGADLMSGRCEWINVITMSFMTIVSLTNGKSGKLLSMKIHLEENIKAPISETLNCLFIRERSENYMPRQYSFIISFSRAFDGCGVFVVHSGTWCFLAYFPIARTNRWINLFTHFPRISFSTNILCFVVLFVDKMTLQMFYDCFIYVDFQTFGFRGGSVRAKVKWLRGFLC